MKLLRAVPEEEVVVRKRLKPGGLANREASALPGIVMDEVVTVLCDVAGNRGRRITLSLNTETVAELSTFPVLVIGLETGKVEVAMALGRILVGFGKRRR